MMCSWMRVRLQCHGLIPRIDMNTVQWIVGIMYALKCLHKGAPNKCKWKAKMFDVIHAEFTGLWKVHTWMEPNVNLTL